MGEDEEIKMVEALKVQYSDLILLSSSNTESSVVAEEVERLNSVLTSIMEALGPSGTGLLIITGAPNTSQLRQNLLPLARSLALLNNGDRKQILKDHGLGSDVPLKNLDRIVSSFAMQLKYGLESERAENGESHEGADSNNLKKSDTNGQNFVELPDFEFQNLGSTFRKIGFCMMEMGLCLARICDRAIGGHELEQSLIQSGTAKGRLIHYHSALDNLIVKESARRKGSTKQSAKAKPLLHSKGSLEGSKCTQRSVRGTQSEKSGRNAQSDGNDLWQQWHYDYGIFTVLTTPLFISNGKVNNSIANEHLHTYHQDQTYLQIFDPNKNEVLMVRAPPESFIVQVGESADIISKGKLRAALHSVYRPRKSEHLSRETFVVFLQPAWGKTFSLSNYPMENILSSSQDSKVYDEEANDKRQEPCILTTGIHKIVPPLSSRLKEGMTFAEFSRETTKKYYGGNGLQSKR
ncbi:hypothetical protein RJ641_030308 [Dillenia turbinata]|uniref:Isopenicillin N synthase-like Fe(2+) 2OG dioxygenase domain-containing protein n=1 Tax=Dillenia turbinata TaxID=194707 RepID=A0AAN8W3F8_9MAGN